MRKKNSFLFSRLDLVVFACADKLINCFNLVFSFLLLQRALLKKCSKSSAVTR